MTVDEYIANLPSPQHEVTAELRRLVKEVIPPAKESIKWGMPVFERNGLLCYIDSAKQYVRFGFYRGAELTDPESLLEGTGKGLRHIKVRTVSSIHKKAYADLVKAASRLNSN